jgi:thiol-disulfide isomerase/thioredoxin
MQRFKHWPLLVLALTLACAPRVWAQDAAAQPAAEAAADVAADPARALWDKVLATYRGQEFINENTTLVQKVTMGEQSRMTELHTHTVIDRKAGRVMLGVREGTQDKDTLTVVVKDKQVHARFIGASSHADRYLQAPMKDSLSLAELTEHVPVIASLPAATLGLALSDTPIEAITGDADATMAYLDKHASDEKLEGLALTAGGETMKLWFDRQSHLLTRVDLPLPAGVPQGVQVEIYATTTNRTEPGEDPAAAFAFNTEGLTAVDEYIKLINLPTQPDHPLTGKAAPAITLASPAGEAFDLTKAPKDTVLVFDFWATWCGPCVQAMPALHDFAKWAKDNDKPVQVYAINVNETVADVTAFWTEHKLTLPVLMDSDGTVAQAYGVQGIPMTVMVYNGKVEHVQIGYRPGIEKAMQERVEEIIKPKSAPAEAPAVDPAM